MDVHPDGVLCLLSDCPDVLVGDVAGVTVVEEHQVPELVHRLWGLGDDPAVKSAQAPWSGICLFVQSNDSSPDLKSDRGG